MSSATDAFAKLRQELGSDAQEMCQTLLRIDTTNPPGNERPAADYLAGKLREVDLEVELLEAEPERTNLVTRYRGDGTAAPLLLAAHLDVVEADPDAWSHPPFAGTIADGCLWGRGAIDMKNMAAMSAAVMRRLARERPALERDVVFAAVADEETGCDLGSRFLVEEHPELVRAEYALGEVGGFSLHIAGSTFYPVQVAEKGVCWVRATVTGDPGHGSMPRSDSAVVKLAEAVAKLGKTALPIHPSEYVRRFLHDVSVKQPAAVRPLLRVLSHPMLLPRVLKLLPDQAVARGLGAILSNTASPTVLEAGAKINVIPGRATALIDGRTLPGQSDEDFLRELRQVMGDEVTLEVVKSLPPVETTPFDSPLFDIIRDEIVAREPGSVVVPYLIPGFTDAKYFTALGAKWYGFAPVKLKPGSGLRFSEMYHGHNERIPLDGLHWGAELLYDVVTRFCASQPEPENRDRRRRHESSS